MRTEHRLNERSALINVEVVTKKNSFRIPCSQIGGEEEEEGEEIALIFNAHVDFIL